MHRSHQTAGALVRLGALTLALLVPAGGARGERPSATAALSPHVPVPRRRHGDGLHLRRHQPAGGESIGTVDIRPAVALLEGSVVPSGPAGWSAETDGDGCSYQNPGDPGVTSRRERARRRSSSWPPPERPGGRPDGTIRVAVGGRTPPTATTSSRRPAGRAGGLDVTAYTFEVLDVVAASGPAAPAPRAHRQTGPLPQESTRCSSSAGGTAQPDARPGSGLLLARGIAPGEPGHLQFRTCRGRAELRQRRPRELERRADHPGRPGHDGHGLDRLVLDANLRPGDADGIRGGRRARRGQPAARHHEGGCAGRHRARRLSGDGGPLTFALVKGPAHGTLSGSGPSLAYTPEAHYAGEDGFTFTGEQRPVDVAACIRCHHRRTGQPPTCLRPGLPTWRSWRPPDPSGSCAGPPAFGGPQRVLRPYVRSPGRRQVGG